MFHYLTVSGYSGLASSNAATPPNHALPPPPPPPPPPIERRPVAKRSFRLRALLNADVLDRFAAFGVLVAFATFAAFAVFAAFAALPPPLTFPSGESDSLNLPVRSWCDSARFTLRAFTRACVWRWRWRWGWDMHGVNEHARRNRMGRSEVKRGVNEGEGGDGM